MHALKNAKNWNPAQRLISALQKSVTNLDATSLAMMTSSPLQVPVFWQVTVTKWLVERLLQVCKGQFIGRISVLPRIFFSSQLNNQQSTILNSNPPKPKKPSPAAQ